MAIVPLTLFDAQDSTGIGNSFNLETEYSGNNTGILKDFTCVGILGGTANATAVTVNIEGSIDNANWFTLASHTFRSEEITVGQAMFHVIGKPTLDIRGNLKKMVGGTVPTLTLTVVAHNG